MLWRKSYREFEPDLVWGIRKCLPKEMISDTWKVRLCIGCNVYCVTSFWQSLPSYWGMLGMLCHILSQVVLFHFMVRQLKKIVYRVSFQCFCSQLQWLTCVGSEIFLQGKSDVHTQKSCMSPRLGSILRAVYSVLFFEPREIPVPVVQ